MKYNRALDYTALALNELSNGKPVLAARLLAKAGEQGDLEAAIRILEASNKAAFASEISAKTRLNASLDYENENIMEDAVQETTEDPNAVKADAMDGDPLDEVECDEECEEEKEESKPAMAMASVLKRMVRTSK